MYAGTKFNWYDNSAIASAATAVDYDYRTLFLSGFSADKGTEKAIRIHGDDFYKMYGRNLSFTKHGQPLLQAARVIDAGGELYVKRVAAADATLSNIILVAKVTSVTTQKKNAGGQLLYIDATTGNETTVSEGNLPVNITSASVKWEAKTATNCKTFEEVYEQAEALLDDATGSYPLFVIADIGRNKDLKKVRITPDYNTSKGLGFMIYSIADIESNSVEEAVTITANPNLLYINTSYAITRTSMGQLETDMVAGAFEAYVAKLSDLTLIEETELAKSDVIFGCNCKGVALSNVAINSEGVNLAYEYGIELKSGSDGAEFGTTPFTSAAYATALANFFKGTNNDEIFDVDVHKIAIACDANYPVSVKEALVDLANFRQDFIFLRDLGLGLNTFDLIAAKAATFTKSKFVADYLTTYQVIDPYTKKRIEVTITYDLAPILVAHFQKSAAIPLAGEINDVVISSAIEGTINYIPRNTPTVNQKDLLDDARINYATYYEYGGKLVVEALYTSQEEHTQLSYLNNVAAIQEVMRAIRSSCPKTRFKFQAGSDFTDYAEAVEAVLTNYKSSFEVLNFKYQQDDIKAAQKIFYASIEFAFNKWAQSEVFDLYAINSTTLTTE